MSRRWVAPLALMAVVVAAVALAAGRSDDDRSLEARTRRVTSELRCPSCQGLSAAESPAFAARAIVDDVRRRVEAGESEEAIKALYVIRYGEQILLRPSSDGIGALVWALPVAAVLLGAGGLALAFRRWRSEPGQAVGEEDRRLVQEARSARERSEA